jgi:hypothetical protein
MAHRFTHQELYDLVWSEPMQKVAKRFGVSDVVLAKKCRAAAIAIPERGYWARRQANKTMIQPPLAPCLRIVKDRSNRYREVALVCFGASITVAKPGSFQRILKAVKNSSPPTSLFHLLDVSPIVGTDSLSFFHIF